MTNLAAFLLGLVAGFLFMNFFGQKRVIHTDSFVEKQDVGKIKQKGRGNNMEAEHSLIERIFTPLKSNKEEQTQSPPPCASGTGRKPQKTGIVILSFCLQMNTMTFNLLNINSKNFQL